MISVEDLVLAPKTINKKRPAVLKPEHRHYRADISLSCSLDNISFVMFLRKMVSAPENFTIGLRLEAPNPFLESPLVLVRFQGPHGGQSVTMNQHNFHNDFHIHLYSQTDLDRRRKLASNSSIKAKFASYEEAIISFLSYCNINDPHDIFRVEKDRINQITIDFPNNLPRS